MAAPAYHEDNLAGRIEGDRREGNAVGAELLDVGGGHQLFVFVEDSGVGEEGSGVAFVAHAEEDEVELRRLAFTHVELAADRALVDGGCFVGVETLGGHGEDAAGVYVEGDE